MPQLCRHAAVVFCLAGCLAAQTENPVPPEKQPPFPFGIRTLVRDHALMWSSPARMSRKDLKFVLPVAGLTALALTTDRRLHSSLPHTEDQIRVSKVISVAGTYYSIGAFAGGMMTAGFIARDRRAVETGLLAATAVTHTESVAQMLKYAFGRERPDFNAAGGGRFWRREQSFPSGHAMGTFAVATIVSREYHEIPVIRYGAYALPVLISAARIGAERHFLSDVLAGGSIGYLIGGWLYEQHHNPALGGAPLKRGRLSVVPNVGYHPKFGGLVFSLTISR